MRIILVHPAGSNWIPGKKDITATANRMAPLGLLSIAAYLEREGHTVRVHDCLGPRSVAGVKENVRIILGHAPELVGFSATTSGFLDGWEMAAAIKAESPDVRTVFGGVHVSALGKILLEDFPHIDYLAPGEGEATLAELAAGEDPARVDGLIWKRGEEIVVNPPRAPLPDLDALPFPAYEKLAGFPRGYNLPLFSYIRFPGATMITSRGCPYQCSYCDRSVFKRGYRYNSPAYIYDHMKHLRTRFGVRHVNIYDDLFTANRPRIAELSRMLTENPLGMQFNCAVRVGYTDRELLRMLREAGCLMVSLGIESADPEMLQRHKAGVTLEEVRETVEMIKAEGLRAKGLFMMGLPGETEESIRRTGDFVLSLGLDDMNMAKFTPFPGAPLWKTIREEGTFEEDWRQMNCLNFVFVPRGIASRERLDQLYNEYVKRFYTDPSWRRRFRDRLWQHRHSLWHMVRHMPDFIAARRHFEPEVSLSGGNRFEDFFVDEAYVTLKNHLYNYLLRRRAIRKCMQLQKSDLILEVGCGLSPMMDNSDRIVFSELSFPGLRTLKRSFDRGHFVVADAAHLPFKAGSFSQVICSEVLEHLPDDQSALREISMVMKPGGALILTFPHRRSFFAIDDRFVNHFRRYELDEMKTNLDEVGLKAVEIQKVFGPLEKITMMTVIALITLFDRFRKGKGDGKRGQRVASPGFLVTLFDWLNRLYCLPVLLDARLAPRCLSSVLLIRAVRHIPERR